MNALCFVAHAMTQAFPSLAEDIDPAAGPVRRDSIPRLPGISNNEMVWAF